MDALLRSAGTWRARCLTSTLAHLQRGRDERGDVPGWVLVTVMSAGVVAVLYGVAKEELTQMLRDALSSVQ